MKRFISLFVFGLIFFSYLYAQGEVEAGRMSRNDLYGTARSMSMGGAFGALGGDLTGVSINPAGIAVYRSSEVVGTADLSQERSNVGDISRDKTSFKMDNMGFVGYFPLRGNTIPFINFGFAYNKVKSFNKKMAAYNGKPDSSLMDYIADISTYENVDPAKIGSNKNPFDLGAPWLTALGVKSYLIFPYQDEQGYFYTPLHNEPITNSLELVENGSVNNYDFTIGTTLGKKVNVGLTLTVTDIYYNLSSRYSEEFERGESAGFDLRNYLTTEGAGVGAKIGVIYRPVNELRIGVAYHTPVWCSLTDTYSAEMEHNVTEYVIDTYPDYKPGIVPPRPYIYGNDYRFKTPDKWVMSIAGVMGNKFIASLDYELANYQDMKFKGEVNELDAESMYDSDNRYISEDYEPASTVRVGLEYRFTPQFSGRIGYAWMQNPYDAEYREGTNIDRVTAIAGSTTIYRIEGDASYFTGGVGYRFNRNFYLDLAFVYKTQKDDLYPFPTVFDSDGNPLINRYSLKNTNIKGLLTLGYKF
jgi:hypothetical protein